MLSSLYHLIFQQQLSELDERDPFWTTSAFGHRIDIILPDISFQIQAVVIQLLHVAVSCVIGTIIYFTIIREWKQRPKSERLGHSPSTLGLLMTFGVIAPLVFMIPIAVIQRWNIQIRCFRMLLVALPFTVSLSCTEAMCGFTPAPAMKSWKDYILSMAFIVRPVYRDGEHVRTTWMSIIRSLLGYVFYTHITNIFIVLLNMVDFEPFPVSRASNDPSLIVSLEVGQWYNTFFQAFSMNLTLVFGMMGIAGVMKLLTGREYEDRASCWPMICGESPSDFWRRWNLLVHHGLKQGVYKPVRWHTMSRKKFDWKKKDDNVTENDPTKVKSLPGGGSPMIAAMTTFTVSAIYHEFVWYLIFMDSKPDIEMGCINCYRPMPWIGKQMIFFCFNGLLVLIEYSWVGRKLSILKKYLPRFIICHLTVMCALPFGHLFTGDMIHSNYFTGILIGMVDVKLTKLQAK